MGDSLSVDLAGLRAAAAGQNDIAERAMLVAAELKAAIASAGLAWGTDKPGKTFEEFYLPSSEQAVEALDQLVSALDELGTGLAGSANAFEAGDIASGSHVTRHDPFAWEPRTVGPTAVPPGLVPAGSSAERIGSIDPVQREGESTPALAAESPGRGHTAATNPERNGQPGSDGQPRRQLPEGIDPETSGPEQAGHAPLVQPTGPVNQRIPGGKPTEPRSAIRPGSATPISPTTANTAQTKATPWSGAPSKDTGGPPARAVSAPQSPNRAGDPLPSRPMAPQPTRRRKSEQVATGRPGDRSRTGPASGSSEKARPGPRPDPMPARATAPEVLRIAREMAVRHGLSLVGFELAGISESAVRGLAAALDQVLTTHHLLDIRTVEIADSPDGRTASIRWDRVGGDSDAVTDAARLVLDRAKITEPLPEHTGGTPDRVVSPVVGPIHAAVIRELGRALDAMGEHAAHRKVQRTLIAHFVENVDPQAIRNTLGRLTADYRRWRSTLPGVGAGAREFDPEAVLVEAFAEVVTGSTALGGASAALHRLLVETAAGAR